MKDRRTRAKKVWQRKVAKLAAYSRKNTVKNCTIPNSKGSKEAEWYADDWYYKLSQKAKEAIRKRVGDDPKHDKYVHKPWYMLTRKERKKTGEKLSFRPKGKAWFMEQMVQHKLAKWEKRNPCPVKIDTDSPDLFEKEYLAPWNKERENALEHFRDFVVSMYDKLSLIGHFEVKKNGMNDYVDEKVAEIKDVQTEGHKVNELDPKKSKLLKKAQKETNKVKAKRPNLVCTNLKDHKKQKGRIILPKAA